MENWLFYCGCAFICAFIISLLATPACKLLAWQTGFLDTPAAEAHKGHKKSTPLLGGLANLITDATGIRVTVAKNPLESVCLGIGRVIESSGVLADAVKFRQK